MLTGHAVADRLLLSYSPHNGLTDQLRQLSLARALAESLKRTLVIPPLLSHFDATGLQTSAEHEVRLASRLLKLRRPHLASLINVSSLGVPTISSTEIPSPLKVPPCSRGNTTQLDPSRRRCIHHVEPPPPSGSTADYLRALARTHRRIPWLHFRSLLWVHSERTAKRNPLPTWEEQMLPTACLVQYRRDVWSAAVTVLRRLLPPPSLPARYMAAHVRSLREAQSKSESAIEWSERLVSFVNAQQRPPRPPPPSSTGPRTAEPSPSASAFTLYVASDDGPHVVPHAAAVLAGLNVTVVSGADVAPELLRTIHEDAATALLALDAVACIAAEAFSPSSRSGFSVHLAAVRACQRRRESCKPHACVAFASTACGGRFPPAHEPWRDALRHGPHSKQCRALHREGARLAPPVDPLADRHARDLMAQREQRRAAATHDAKTASARTRLKAWTPNKGKAIG
jgi:hypothetical protein